MKIILPRGRKNFVKEHAALFQRFKCISYILQLESVHDDGIRTDYFI